jgi:hypothetical protein
MGTRKITVSWQLLPILGRELRGRARSRATHWTRVSVALTGILVCGQALEWAPAGSPAALGRLAFGSLVAAAFVVSCCACLLTADAISAERREGTLALLLLTRVKTMDVVLGKLGATGLAGLLAMVAFVPVLGLPILAGGVGLADALRTALALLNSLFFALVTGLWVSAPLSEHKQAVWRSLLVIALFSLCPLLVGALVPFYGFTLVGMLSPLCAVLAAGADVYGKEPWLFWGSLGVVHVVSWWLLLWAGMRLQVHAGSQALPVSPAPAKREAPTPLGLGRWQPERENSGPIEWVVYRCSGISVGVWSLAVLALAARGWAELAATPLGPRVGLSFLAFAGPLSVVADLVGGAVVAWVASRFFVTVRRSGELELLLTTPLGADTLVQEQWAVLRRIFVWPVLMMQAVMIPFLFSDPGFRSGSALLQLFWLTGLKGMCVANAYLGVVALCWAGLWFGLRARTQPQAVVWTAGLAKGIPLLVTLLGSFILNSCMRQGIPIPAALFWVPQALVLGFYLVLIVSIQRDLSRDPAGAEPASLKRMLARRTSDHPILIQVA